MRNALGVLLTDEQRRIYGSMRTKATNLVYHAINTGWLPRLFDYGVQNNWRRILRGIKCIDCEKSAEVYDHRDYFQPLAVEPVCFSCNMTRGPAEKTILLIIERYPAVQSMEILRVRSTQKRGLKIISEDFLRPDLFINP